jgi:simple sugar transport system ATP-binding protein
VTPALELRGIAKRFGPVHALRGADFTLAPGEVHALLGENGAGKSTLMHIASGAFTADRGTISVGGRVVRPRSPGDARRLGIGLVHQHFTAIPAFTVAENVALAADWAVGRPRRLHARVADLAERTGLILDPQVRTDTLSVGARQRLEILRALAADTTILLLDEPTAVLAPSETAEVLDRLRAFAAAGGSAVLITHKLDEALAAADRITVLREGRTVRTGDAAAETPRSLAAAMLGDAPALFTASPPAGRPGAVRVSARGLTLPREDGRGIAVRSAEFEVRAGEVLGFAAVDGSGQRELLRTIAGLGPPSGGSLEVAQPVAFVPEDRSTEAIIGELSVAHNVALGLRRQAWWRGGRLDWDAISGRTRELAARYGIRGASPEAPAASLSGGNQQKLVVARALSCTPEVIVAENPTRGLDVRAAAAVWAALRGEADRGAAVLVWSSDLDEVVTQATRLLVVARGEVRDVPSGSDPEAIGRMMLDPTGRPGKP